MGEDFSPLGKDLFGEPIRQNVGSPIARNFVFPPFSVLSARDGEWQERKQAWLSLGIKSEIGREGLGDTCVTPMSYFGNGKTIAGDAGSIFDPVLCELIYRWFSAPGWQVLDPFCGGSVRGIVAGLLGRKYWGGELRAEQVGANQEQVAAICPDALVEYVVGDSTVTVPDAPMGDLIFSCPPYGDLEVYSNDAADLSNMEHDDFLTAYQRIIAFSCGRLRQNRFACFVVGDFRDKFGHLRNFVSDTIAAFQSCGLCLYNEVVLVTPVGTAAIRASAQFPSGRKLCKTHQNVLVFIKGDWRKAVADLNNQ